MRNGPDISPRSRRSAPRRARPLVIEGDVRRIGEPARSHAPAPLAPAPRASPGRERTAPPSFFGRSAEPELDLFRHGRKRPFPPVERLVPETPHAVSPMMIGAIAGIALALVFVLPGLVAKASSGPNRESSVEVSAAAFAHGAGFEVAGLDAKLARRGAGRVLTVSGRITNRTSIDTIAPPLDIALRDEDGARGVRRISIADRPVRGGETLNFISSVLMPQEMAGSLRIAPRRMNTTEQTP